MRTTPFTARARFAAPGILAIVLLAVAGCGPQGQPGGFQGFPPAPVTLLAVQPVTVPIRFEYVGQTAGSKEAQVRARVQGILERRTYQEGGRVSAGRPCLGGTPLSRRLTFLQRTPVQGVQGQKHSTNFLKFLDTQQLINHL